jgi:hypothetical protein
MLGPAGALGEDATDDGGNSALSALPEASMAERYPRIAKQEKNPQT